MPHWSWILFGVVVLVLIGGLTWVGNRKPRPSKPVRKSEPPKIQKPAKVSGPEQASLKEINPSGFAILSRVRGGGELFVPANLVKASGLKDTDVGRIFRASWVESTRKKERLDVTELHPD